TATERSEGAAQHRVAWRGAPPETTRALRPRPSAAKEQVSTGWAGGSALQKQHERRDRGGAQRRSSSAGTPVERLVTKSPKDALTVDIPLAGRPYFCRENGDVPASRHPPGLM